MIDIDVLKYRRICYAASLLFIAAGLVMFLVSGFNKGIDFGSGYSCEVQIAPVAMTVSYDGKSDVTLNVQNGAMTVETRDASGVRTALLSFSDYPTSALLASALRAEGIDTTVVDGDAKSANIITGITFPMTLSPKAERINSWTDSDDISISHIREALKGNSGAKVQTKGSGEKEIYQIRLMLDGDESPADAESRVRSSLASFFGEESIVVLQSDYVGPKFSKTLLSSSIKAVLIAFALILVYISFRFRLAYAFASVVALIHDVAMMLSFVLLLRLEVSGTTIAAVLTIIGYSLNNTIVIFDRVRENIKGKEGKCDVAQMISWSVRLSFTRTFFTTLTTLFAVVPLAIFSSGEIKLFSINLVWGLVVGAYSSSFLAPALLLIFHSFFPVDTIKEEKEYSLVDD